MKTNPNDFAFNDSATRLLSATKEGIEAHNPPLTKREILAAFVMPVILKYCLENEIDNIFDTAANDSVRAADALINALNEKP